MSDRVDRTVSGGRAAFFDNPESDRLLAMLLKLVSEHWALKERVLSLEKMLVDAGVLTEEQLETFTPDAATDARWDMESFELVRSVVESARNIRR